LPRVPAWLLVILGVVIAAVAAAWVFVWRPSAEALIKGETRSAVLDGTDPGARVIWSRARADDSVLPWRRVAIAQAEWSVGWRDAWDRGCLQQVVLLHPLSWQLSAISDRSFSWGESSHAVEAIAQEHPAILETDEHAKTQRSVAGSMLSRPLTGIAAQNEINIIWQVPETAGRAGVKVGVGVVCADRLAGFAWLQDAGTELDVSK